MWGKIGHFLCDVYNEKNGALETAKELAKIFEWYIFPILGAVAILWAVWIGIAFATAKDEQHRTQAKSRLFKALASIMIIAVLWFIMANLSGDIKFTLNE
jgi:hypothetical protein